jgi:hypothetical protein
LLLSGGGGVGHAEVRWMTQKGGDNSEIVKVVEKRGGSVIEVVTPFCHYPYL